MITGYQVKAARIILDLTIRQLGHHCGINESTIIRMEAMKHDFVTNKFSTILRVKNFFESRGVTFTVATQKGWGIGFERPVDDNNA